MTRRAAEYDVCLNAHPSSAHAARVIAKFFRSAGLRVFLDETSEGSPRLWANHHAVAAARAYVVLLGDGTPSAWAMAELEWGLKRRAMYDDLLVLPLVREGFQPGPGPLGHLIEVLEPAHLPEDKTDTNARLRDLAARLREPLNPTRLPIYENEPESARPFMGLHPYGQRSSRFFFGRDAEVIEVGQRLGRVHTGHRRWVHVSGPSGAGKSSLVRAGLIPAVQRGVVPRAPADWVVAALRPGRRPVHRLAESLTRAFGGDLWVGEALEQLRGDNGLAELVQEALPADKGLLLVLDRLEDLLNVHDDEISTLDRLLAGAIDDFDERLYLVTTARDDLGQRVMARLPRTARLAEGRATYVDLGAPTREGLWEAIVGPVRLAGGRFADGLAERILDDVERTPDSLPRLGYLLSMLWDRSWEGDLTHATYEALGGVSGALARDSRALLDALGPEEQRRAQAMLLSMVAVGRGRGDAVRAVSRAEALAAGGGGPKADAVLESLLNIEKGGFVERTRDELDDEAPVPADDEGTPIVRLVHDTLLRDWPTLREWAEQARGALERRDETEAAAAHHAAVGGRSDDLPREDRLRHHEGADLPEGVRDTYKALLNAEGRRFLESARQAERRRDETQEAHRQAGQAAEAAHRAGERARTDALLRKYKLGIGGLIAVSLLALSLMFNAFGERDDLLFQRNTVEGDRRRMNEQRAKLEEEKLALEKQRLEMEQRYRDAERGRRAVGRESARAGQTADELLRIAMEIAAVADDTIKRIPGEQSKYARRVVSQAVGKRMQEALDAAPDNEFLRFAVARQHQIQGDLWAEQKQLRTALASYEQAGKNLDLLLATAAPVPKYFECQASVHMGMGDIFRGKPFTDGAQAAASYKLAIAAQGRLAEVEPDVDDHRIVQADLQRRVARIAAESRDMAGQRAALEAVQIQWKALADRPQPQPIHLVRRAEALADLADLDLADGKTAEARTRYEEANGIATALPSTPDVAADLGRLVKRLKARLKP